MTTAGLPHSWRGKQPFHRRASFSGKCLSCSNPLDCCGSTTTAFDGASPKRGLGMSRRDALKIMGAVSAALALVPLIGAAPQYLIPQVPSKFQETLVAQTTDVPVNGSIIFWFPFTTDPTYTNMLIHLPPNLAEQAGSEFVAYNRTCIHLQCLVSYLANSADPDSSIIGCPCHGSIYRPTDGWPIGGPAAQIGRYLPNVTLRIDGTNVYATNINLDDIGYGNTTPPQK